MTVFPAVLKGRIRTTDRPGPRREKPLRNGQANGFHAARSQTPPRRRDPSWDYRGAITKRYTHGMHSYPAMMIPQVAERLIDDYTAPGDVILDPFCGSGSVL